MQPTENWIFIRGLTREAAHWGKFRSLFETAFSHARVLCLDIPGNGSRWRETSPTTVPEMAEAVRDEYLKLTAQGPALPTYLMTISLGSMVALEWMRQHPKDISGAVLINSSVRGVSPFFRRMRPSAFFKSMAIMLKKDSYKKETSVLKLTSSSPLLHSECPDEWSKIRELRPVSAQNAWRQLVAAMRYQVDSAGTALPHLLILNSANDRMVHPSCSQSIHRIWGSTLKTHPTAGHDLPLDDPSWVITTIDEWKASKTR